ncbi:hypothetical protein [Spirosoma montaniterrae]|uniref:Uncharacterized protein n=1 Tax=Spirosoma montaniterrae TaxID=1178516 RepID=A0A1P9X2I1_9BACT|nr:hypothetical protein [Spirosoma montaniterrae]AQG81808.1 hypothetical protein AWR27_22380 [Spirosoma montaniterrae]
MSVFSKDAGRFLNPHETESLTGCYRDRKVEVGLKADEYIRSEFFGLNQVMELLGQEGCVGLRVHHAKRWEDADGNPTETGKGQLKPRVLLTGVYADGKDMPIKTSKAGMKDDDGNGSLGDGHTCPPHCKS